MTEIRQVLKKIPQQQVADELNWKKPESKTSRKPR